MPAEGMVRGSCRGAQPGTWHKLCCTACAALHCHHMARDCTWGRGQTRHVIDIQGSRGRCTMHQVCPRVVAYDAWRCRLVNAMKSDITDCETVA